MKKITKKQLNKKDTKEKDKSLFFKGISPQKSKILLLLILNIFLLTGIIVKNQFFTKAIESVVIYAQTDNRNIILEKQIKDMVEGYPIEKMIPYIAKYDQKTAAFLVSIAKKESAWGKRKPVLDGQDCYNYWGFRLKSEKMGSGGHTCFNSPKEAVIAVGERIEELVNKEKIDTPSKMIVWKCGYGCSEGAKTESEQKWVKDVGMYYKVMVN
jgi:hypothetical protein